MTEIEKMFENAGIEKEFEKPAECSKNPYITCDGCMLYDDKKGKCNNRKDYPPFTAEKQIELIKWLAKLDGHFEISCIYNKEAYLFNFYFNRKTEKHKNPTFPYSIIKSSDFVELLAKQINELWQSLTDKEKEEIRKILNE
jgi:hypothetical protein